VRRPRREGGGGGWPERGLGGELQVKGSGREGREAEMLRCSDAQMQRQASLARGERGGGGKRRDGMNKGEK
jgi:hypothetical protein